MSEVTSVRRQFVIVGSAIVNLIHEKGEDAPGAVREYVRSMKQGMQ